MVLGILFPCKSAPTARRKDLDSNGDTNSSQSAGASWFMGWIFPLVLQVR